MNSWWILPLVALILMLNDFAAVARVGVHFLHRKAELPAAQVVRDIRYLPGPDCDKDAPGQPQPAAR